MADFKGTADTISTIKETLDTIQTTLEDTLTRAETVQGTLNDEAIWAGEAQLVGAAFLDLVVQYHGKLAPAEDGPVSCNAALYSRQKKHFIFDSINIITALSFR